MSAHMVATWKVGVEAWAIVAWHFNHPLVKCLTAPRCVHTHPAHLVVGAQHAQDPF